MSHWGKKAKSLRNCLRPDSFWRLPVWVEAKIESLQFDWSGKYGNIAELGLGKLLP